jgi:hypothetical protein
MRNLSESSRSYVKRYNPFQATQPSWLESLRNNAAYALRSGDMARALTRILKRWRDNYYFSLLLASSAKPLRFISARTARFLEQKVRKNGGLIRLPNGKSLSIAVTTSNLVLDKLDELSALRKNLQN